MLRPKGTFTTASFLTLTLTLTLTLALAASTQAQQTTSPRGFATVAGGNLAALGMFSFGSGNQAHELVQVDDTQRGRPQMIKAMHLRQHAFAAGNPLAKARSLNLIARMAHADYAKVTGALQQLNSILIGTWANVSPQQLVAFPDMTKVAPGQPAPWSIKIPFATPFAYDGNSALAFQLQAWAATPTGSYPIDAIDETMAMSWGNPVAPGTGCKHAGREMTVFADFTVHAGNLPADIFIATFPQVTSQPQDTLAAIGVTNPNVRLPGFCAPVLASFEVIVPMWQPVFSEDGQQGWFTYYQLPHANAFVGLQLNAQAWAVDPARPLMASSGWRTGKYPAPPVPQTRVAGARVINTLPGQFTQQTGLKQAAGVIVGLER